MALKRTAKTCGPDAAVLASRWQKRFRQRRWQKAVHRGERVISRKAIAQGMSDVLRCPVCSCAHFSLPMRMRPRVQRASGIPCALWIRRGREVTGKPRAQCVARMRPHIPVSSPGLTGRPSIPETPMIEPISRGVLDPRMRGDDNQGYLKCESGKKPFGPEAIRTGLCRTRC